MNTSQSRFAKMPAAPPSPPTLPRQTWASLGSPTEETGEAYHVLLDNDRKVAVRRDAPELIEPEEESDDEEDDRTRLYEDACRARDNAANYDGRFEPELFGVMAAQARVGRARSRGDGPRGERVCVMCGASKCFACGACGLSAYCGAVCQKRDYGAHYVVCKAARKDV